MYRSIKALLFTLAVVGVSAAPKENPYKPICEQPTPTKTPHPTQTYQSCGGFRISQVPCPKGYICMDDPYVGGCGMACDAPGICVKPVFCGGIANIQCKDKNKLCVDDPQDDCDPDTTGRDCGGVCV